MNRKKKLSNRLMAILLSMAMIFSSMLQSMPVYAAEDGVETESVVSVPEDLTESAADVSGNDTADKESVADVSGNDNTDAAVEPTDDVSANDVTDDTEGDSVSDNDVTNETDETENPFGSEIKATVKAAATEFSLVGGWNESIYAEINGISASDVLEVSWTGTMNGTLNAKDKEYLVRNKGDKVRIDVLGLKEGTYTLNVKVGTNTLTKSGIEVAAYDRSGFAHFNYTRGVGAYNNDGTLKDNAEVLYVTDENKNDVTLTVGGVTVKGIGNILNSVGKDAGTGTASNGGKPNTNQDIIYKLAKEGRPLVVRFIGSVSETGYHETKAYDPSVNGGKGLIDGLTVYNSVDYGGTAGDNGHMARIQSGKDITLEGVGYDAQIDGWGFHFISEGREPKLGESFEVRNLTFINTPEDAVGMEGQQASKNANSLISSKVERCWIHHNEFYCPNMSKAAESDKSEGDGSVDFKRGQYFTCSYNYFEGCHKTNLVGSADYSLQFNLSYHHNYWYMCKARGPLTRRANVHMYNNIFEMQTDYAMNTRVDAYIFSEYNMFFMCKSPHAVEGGAIKSFNDSLSGALYNKGKPATVVTDKTASVANNCKYSAEDINYSNFDTDPKQSYIPNDNYQLTTDFTELRKLIVAETGVMAQQPKAPKDVTESEYSVINKVGETPYQVQESDFGTALSNVGDKNNKVNKKGYAFTVNTDFNIAVKYADGSKDVGVLVNAAGENLLEGNGEAINLPAGTYMLISANTLQPGDSKSLTVATVKEFTVESVVLEKFDTTKHYHNWVKNASLSKAADCTNPGSEVYECKNDGCDVNTKTETVPALGHNYVWKTDKAATDTEDGEKHRECTRCADKQDVGTTIPAGSTSGSSGEGGGSGVITDAGDYVITFAGKKPNQDGTFFTIDVAQYKDKATATVNGEVYNGAFAFNSKGKLSFTCNDGAKLLMVFDSSAANRAININGEDKAIDADGKLELELSAGKYTFSRGGGTETLLVYMSVTNGAPQVTYYNITFDYNDDEGRDPVTVKIAEGTSYASKEALAPEEFVKSGYMLKELYTDVECENPVTYPYVVMSNADLYADWEVDTRPVVKVSTLRFDSNGGSSIDSVRVAETQIYEITQKPVRENYAFAGWYDAAEGGNLVEVVDGSQMDGVYTVFAHWNVIEAVKNELKAANLDAGDITENKTIEGFTIHAAKKYNPETDPKYYMTVKNSKLYTNGVLLTDTSIEGNADGLLKSIEFTTEGSGYLTVEVELSGKPADNGRYELVLAKKDDDGKLVDVGREAITTGTTKTTKKFDIVGAGTYYLYPDGDKGVAYTSIKFTEQTFTLVYASDNGTPKQELSSAVVHAGDVINLVECTPDAGYIFKGWTADGKTVLTDSYTVKADDVTDGVITLEAVYEAEQYTIKYDVNGGTLAGGAADTVTAVTDDEVTLPVCTPAAGQMFVGWELKGSVISGKTYSVNPADADASKTITLKAKYKAEGDDTESCTVTIDTNGGTLVDGGALNRIVDKETQIDLGECTKDNCTFKGWYVNGEKVGMPYTVTGDVTITAIFELIVPVQTYTLKYESEHGTPSKALHDTEVQTGDVITLVECTPNAGYIFKGWSVDNGATILTGTYTVKAANAVNGVITLKAIYEAVQYTVAYDADGGTFAEGKLNAVTAVTGTVITLPVKEDCITPPAGKQFVGWELSGVIQGQTYTVNPMDADENKTITLKAKYADEGVQIEYIKVIIDPDGGTYLGEGGLERMVEKDTDVDLKACEKSGYRFKGWSVDGVTVKMPYTVTQEVTFKAVYEEKGSNSGEGLAIIGLEESYPYTGAKIIPNIGVVDYDVDGGKILAPGVDYTVKYKNNTKVTTAAVITVTGKGNYAGKDIKKTFKIVEVKDVTADLADLKGARLDKIDPVVYNGEAQYPDFKLTLKTGAAAGTAVEYTYNGEFYETKAGGEQIKANVALSNNINKGTATILITGAAGKNNKPTSIKKTFKINPIDLTDPKNKVTVEAEDGVYSVKGAAPASITVKYGDKTLINGTDYTVKYSNNKKVTDTAKITITGKGNYAKKITTYTYKISPLDLSTVEVSAVNAVEGMKAGKVKATVLDANDNILKPSQYNVEVYVDGARQDANAALAKGTISVKVTAKDTVNLKGDTEAEFNVADKSKDISKAKFVFPKVNGKAFSKTYTGEHVVLTTDDKIEVTITDKGATKKLVMGDDFEIVAYSNNVNKGTATAVVKGIGDYCGTKTIKFKIVGKDMKLQNEGASWDDVSGLIKNLMGNLFD